MHRAVRWTAAAVLASVGVAVGTAGARSRGAADQPSAIRAQSEARREDAAWGTLYTYYAGQTRGTRDGLAAVAVIRPGQEIHPPHEHAEEEYLMVLEGDGTWHLNGRERPARAGDMQYAAPWDLHGIRNTGRVPLRFVVWKWQSKGVAPAARPR
jgi:mannose-6-phosphate isomerase-like protein (cupin superfamily)